ncbi:hypothetical protein JCM33374_g757 [Metschnikowia sp. JCM 33374]|nr:hypothetical protein JCM33374_g757 [Metschnikowia sp. JCM 33374]
MTAMPSPSDPPPILTITTSKNWVLPPRPKNVRKNKCPSEKKNVKQRPAKTTKGTKTPASKTPASKIQAPTAQAPKAQSPKAQSPPVSSTKLATKSAEPKQEKPFPIFQTPLSNTTAISTLDSPEQLECNIKSISCENYQLKTKLLSLIHDYKSLKSLVTSPSTSKATPVDFLYDSTTTARKRVHPEIGDPMNELISDMSGLSHTSPDSVVSPVDQELGQSGFEMELFNFINLEQDSLDNIGEAFEADFHDEDEDDEVDSASLSRLSSPTSDSDENSLMTSLTRSTTVSTTNSFADKKPFSMQFKFQDLPEFSEEDYAFSFEKSGPHDKMMSVIEEDQYNQVADFLEEKLMSNDVQYYVEKSNS